MYTFILYMKASVSWEHMGCQQGSPGSLSVVSMGKTAYHSLNTAGLWDREWGDAKSGVALIGYRVWIPDVGTSR